MTRQGDGGLTNICVSNIATRQLEAHGNTLQHIAVCYSMLYCVAVPPRGPAIVPVAGCDEKHGDRHSSNIAIFKYFPPESCLDAQYGSVLRCCSNAVRCRHAENGSVVHWCSVVQCVVDESPGCLASLFIFTCCSALQRIAVCCSVVHCSALWWSDRLVSHSVRLSLFISATVCCSVLQRVAMTDSHCLFHLYQSLTRPNNFF